MVELTDREKKLIHYIMTMNRPETKQYDLELRIMALKSVILCAGLEWDYDEMKDLSFAIKAENERALANGMGQLNKYKHLLGEINSF